MSASPPDWQLPPGVSRGLWDYLHNPALARAYDASLAGSTLFACDEAFVARHCPAPGRLIDLGCGTGRLLLTSARCGLWALGVDLSSEMLKIAGEKARSAGVTVELLRANLTELTMLVEDGFDHAACLFSTLGMIDGHEQRQRVVQHVFRLLKPGGRFVLHVHNRWFNVWNPEGRRWLWRNALAAVTGKETAGDRVMPPHQGIGNLTLHLFTRREAMRLLKNVGFQLREVQPISLRADGRLSCPWWFGRLRAYGYLIAAERPR